MKSISPADTLHLYMDRQDDANRLKKLYDDRVPEGMSQAEFGAAYEIGTQSMVSQYLSGHRPLNFEAAAKFAKGLRCTIADISPRMAKQIKLEIFPVLGRVSLKAALALALVIPPLIPQKAHAAFNIMRTEYTLRLKGLWRRLSNVAKRCAFSHRFSSQ